MPQLCVKCIACGNEVYRYPSQCLKTIFCSKACRKKYFFENYTTTFKCDFCGKEKTVRKSSYQQGEKHFCCRFCKDEWQKTGLLGKNNPFHGKEHLNATKTKIRVAKIGKFLGKEAANYNSFEVKCVYCGKAIVKTNYLINRSKNLFCSIKCNGKWKAENLIGENATAWNSNLTAEYRETRRKHPKYYEFIKLVMKRDNYKCAICGKYSKWGNGLNVHHLNGYHWDKENRFNINNGITLCKNCHKIFHTTYGYGKNNKMQFLKWRNEQTRNENV